MFTACDQPDLNPTLLVAAMALGSQGGDGPRGRCCVAGCGRNGAEARWVNLCACCHLKRRMCTGVDCGRLTVNVHVGCGVSFGWLDASTWVRPSVAPSARCMLHGRIRSCSQLRMGI